MDVIERFVNLSIRTGSSLDDLAGIIVGAFWEVLVIFGVHWTFVPIMLN